MAAPEILRQCTVTDLLSKSAPNAPLNLLHIHGNILKNFLKQPSLPQPKHCCQSQKVSLYVKLRSLWANYFGRVVTGKDQN